MFGSLPHLDFRLKLSSSRGYVWVFWALFLNFTCGLGFFVLVFEMSDLYENNESGDVSSFLQVLFQNSSSSQHNHDGNRISTSLFVSGGINADASSSSIHFSDPSPTSFLNGDSVRMNSVKHVSGSRAEGSDSFDAAAPNSAPTRSSKRSRAAEVHNLSEKRRRSRINEKLKALQTLIPNANKTDKASVLDEAIEYLKQLQRQVQMLTVRNGLGLHTVYSLSTLQSMLSAPSVPEFHEGSAGLNSTRVPETREQNVFLQNVGETNVATSSTMPNFMTSTISRPISELIPPTQSHYGLLNHLNSSKDICRDDTIFRLQLDLSCSGNNTSPGVSSS